MVIRLNPTYKKTAINVYRCQRCTCPRCRDIRELPKFLTIKCDCCFCTTYKLLPSLNEIRMSRRRSKQPERLSSTDLVKTNKQLLRDKEDKIYKKFKERKRMNRLHTIWEQRRKASKEFFESDAGQRKRCKAIANQLHKSCSIFHHKLHSLSKIQPHNLVTSKMILLKKKLAKIGHLIDTINNTDLPKCHHFDDINDMIFMCHKLYECKGEPKNHAVEDCQEEPLPTNGRTEET